jgi:type IV pilus assembly protein PilW
VSASAPGSTHARPGAHRGVGLVELLVAMTLGLGLLGGALTVYLKARDAHATLETTARLQEVAQHALGVIESDVRMGGYLGLTSRPELVTNLAGALTDASGVPVALRGCAEHWATALAQPVGGWDQSAGAWPLEASCRPNGRWRATTDGLIVRRASAERLEQSAAGVKAYHRHVLVASSHTAAQVFVGDADGSIPADFAQTDPADAPPLADTRRLLVHAYYVSADSSVAAGFPSLRRKRLVSGPAVQDEEIIPGVEDLQVQYGVDEDGDGSTDRYVSADALAADTTVLAARIWLRVRAHERDPAWNDATHYTYANQDERSPAAERAFRRVVVSRTIHLRNARGS